MKLKCKKCEVDYEGHHASKYCPECKGAVLKVDIDPRLGKVERVVEVASCSQAAESICATIEVPAWHAFGMCDGGEELMPNWVYAQQKMVNIGKPLSPACLQIVENAFQIKCINRKPLMGDFDYGGK